MGEEGEEGERYVVEVEVVVGEEGGTVKMWMRGEEGDGKLRQRFGNGVVSASKCIPSLSLASLCLGSSKSGLGGGGGIWGNK